MLVIPATSFGELRKNRHTCELRPSRLYRDSFHGEENSYNRNAHGARRRRLDQVDASYGEHENDRPTSGIVLLKGCSCTSWKTKSMGCEACTTAEADL